MKRKLEREKGRNDAADDLSELSEGEKEKGELTHTDPHTEIIPRINSETQIWPGEDKSRQLYVVLIRYLLHAQSLFFFFSVLGQS